VTQPPPQDPEPTLGRLAGSLGALTQQVADLRRQFGTMGRRLDALGDTGPLREEVEELGARFEELAEAVADALDAASPSGPPAPRWDRLPPADRAKQLAALRAWVDGILQPAYCANGAWTLAACWPNHEGALWELGNLAAQWRRIYDRERPNLPLALEFFDRWLPSVMRHLGDMTAQCTPRCAAEAPRRRQ
jgi:hypothetical protein